MLRSVLGVPKAGLTEGRGVWLVMTRGEAYFGTWVKRSDSQYALRITPDEQAGFYLQLVWSIDVILLEFNDYYIKSKGAYREEAGGLIPSCCRL